MAESRRTTPRNTAPSDRRSEGGLFDGFEAYRTPTEADYRRLLTDGIVVPDANVFLNLYRYNEQTRDDLFSVLHSLGDRLWVPHQVVAEFWKNRESVLRDPRDTSATIRELSGHRDSAVRALQSWANRVSLSRERTSHLIDSLEQAFKLVTDGVSELADDGATEFARNTNADPVLQKLEPIIRGRVGAPLSEDDRGKAITEASARSGAKQPPGYMDAGKTPPGQAGDYLIWHQTILQAALEERDVLFVTGDVKEDWWRREHGELRGPRPELVEELKRQASVRLYMLRPESLLVQARHVLRVDVRDESVQDVERVDQLSAARALKIPTDAESLRARWDDVLESVRGRRKVAWILLSNSTVSEFNADTLKLEFTRDGDAKGFHTSGCYEDVAQVFEEMFGMTPRILVVSPTGQIFNEGIGKRPSRSSKTADPPEANQNEGTEPD